MRHLFTICVLSLFFLTLFHQNAYAKKSFYEALVGSWFQPKTHGPKPEDSLRAPFTTGKAKVDGVEQHEGENLKVPHINYPEVGKWLTTACAESLNYKEHTNQEDLDHLRAYFTDSGWAQYQHFLQQSKLANIIASHKFNLQSHVKREPLLLNSLEHEGLYRWLFEIPIMVTFMNRENFNYEEQEPETASYALRVQVRRVSQEESPYRMLIETWTGTQAQ